MRIRFYHARILTMVNDITILPDAELWTQDGKIAYLGAPIPNPCSLQFDREIDAGGNLLMPGFCNAHTHSGMTFLRSLADDLPLEDWLEKQVFPMESKLRENDVYYLAKVAILEYLTSGITSCFDMYPWPYEMARASVDLGFRTVLCSGLNNFCSSLEAAEREYRELNAYHPLISYHLGFHAEYTTSRALLEGLSDLSQRLKAPVHAHSSETRAEVEACIKRNGVTPTAFMEQLGLFDHGGACYHCVHVTEDDMRILADHKISAVTNPASNAKLASGIAPLVELRAHSVPLALGTDGPASNNCLDFFREMFLATALQKLRLGDPSAFPAEAVLEMAARGGAQAMGLPGCGVLSEGKCADLILLDLRQPNMQPVNHIAKNLVYSASKLNVMLTMVGGQILYENGVFHVGEDPQEIYQKAGEVHERLIKS